MNTQEKMRMARQLDKLGVDVIEAGFPIASDGDFGAVRSIAAEIRRPIICGLARACDKDIQRAADALNGAARPRIHVFLATSDIHLQYKLKISREKCLEQAVQAVALAKSFVDDVEFSPEDATRTDHDFLCQVLGAVIEAGATTLNIPDTVGFSVPEDFGALIKMLTQRVKGIEKAVISAHCHNDLGVAVANTLAAIANGARQVECAINGIGERAVSEQLYPVSQLLSEITGVAVQPNKAIIGRNAFAHAAGIHQDGMLKNPLTYEIITPQSVGVPDSTLVLGKHSGRHALAQRCEKLGNQFERRELDEVYRRFVILADKIKNVEDHHLVELIREARGEAKPAGEAAARVKAAPAPPEHLKPFPAVPLDGSAVPLPRRGGEHHEEDYLWGV
jgi:2-isopropylmalate synthase